MPAEPAFLINAVIGMLSAITILPPLLADFLLQPALLMVLDRRHTVQ